MDECQTLRKCVCDATFNLKIYIGQSNHGPVTLSYIFKTIWRINNESLWPDLWTSYLWITSQYDEIFDLK